MIAALLACYRQARVRHWQRRVQVAGTATLAAHTRRDWPTAARHLAEMHHAQAKRNALLERIQRAEMRREAWLHTDGLTCPPCNHDCCQGRNCPART